MEEKKNPAEIKIAPTGVPNRATHPSTPDNPVASANNNPSNPRLTSTPACACPALANPRWNSVMGTRPVTTLVRNHPPNSMVTMLNNITPPTY
ncbi:hypothetical protein GCM10010452_19450 [Crossiella cryophila]